MQKYLTLTAHVYSAHIDVANLKWFQGLPAADQELIRKCMVEAAASQRNWNRTNEAGFLTKLKEAGMTVDEHPDLASFRTKVAPIKNMEIFQGQQVQDLLQIFLKAAQE